MSTLFHKPGFVYFWFLNDACELSRLDWFIDAFAEADVAAVVIHARGGQLLPYGGSDWFDTVRHIIERCADKGLSAWLYDEDPYPSGSCGGVLAAEDPSREARAIEQHVDELGIAPGELFCFPIGTLLWCGGVRERDGSVIDLTAKVGVVRREWKVFEDANSSHYYPGLPVYDCIRSETFKPEFALRVPELPDGYVLQAFVARPSGRGSVWDTLPDTLNPEVTHEFIRRTHDRYAESVGEWFGNTIPAIFTDEPKYFGGTPWTYGLAEDFADTYGYDLLPRLWQLFSKRNDPDSMKTRLDYRDWCGRRFRESWLEPVSAWCREHGIALTGHISPEDDPVDQAVSVTNLFSCFPYFTIPGIDLIIPAVGDHRHAILNIGVVSATSAAQQKNRPGVMSETLACSGLESNPEIAGFILRWQLVMGVTTHVVHAAFSSVEGNRLYDAPPDWGPAGDFWPAMVELGKEFAELQTVIREATQVAPVAILWPIRSFAAQRSESHEQPLRDALVELLSQCLDHQVGVHFLDETDLVDAAISTGVMTLGRAAYSHVLVPDCTVLAADTIRVLREAAAADIQVVGTGSGPEWVQTDSAVEPAGPRAWESASVFDVVPTLPRLISIAPDGIARDLRCTAWERDGIRTRLLMNIGDEDKNMTVDGTPMRLRRGEVMTLPQG